MSNGHKKHVAIIGGGISGLSAAKMMLDKGYEVDIFDAANRMGGKIHTVRNGDQVADLAAEFIDTDQKNLIKICEDLGVPLVDTNETLASRYLMPNGTLFTEDQFSETYLPLSKQILQDKNTVAADPTGPRARHIDSMSVPQYLQELKQNAERDDRPLWQRIIFFWDKKPEVDPDIITMAEQGFASERGRPAAKISALTFVRESGDTENFIHSDCAKRVDGGTQRLITALEDNLKSRGAHFHVDAVATGITRDSDQKFDITFEKQPEGLQQFDQVIFATPAHVLAEIKGLDDLGFTQKDQDTLQQLQFCHNSKITVKTNIPVRNDGFFISKEGYQTWNRAPGEVVFLIGDDLAERMKPKELQDFVLADRARAHNGGAGLTTEEMFDTSHLVYNGPDVKKPCYAIPAPGQTVPLLELAQSFDKLAEKGIGVVGTYVPQQKGGSVGYMGDGVDSAERATNLMASKGISMEEPERAQWLEQILSRKNTPAQSAAAAMQFV